MVSNIYFQNTASQNGIAIYFEESINVRIEMNQFSNNSISNKNKNEGSVLLLDNPRNIFILNSLFKDNIGIFGTCISYSETSNFDSIVCLTLIRGKLPSEFDE